MMGGFGNVGFGLAKMMEGVSGGALAGKQMEYKNNLYQEQRADQNAVNEGRIQNETDRLSMMAKKNAADADLATQRIEMEKRRVAVSTISSAFEIAKESPDPKGVFKAIQERLNPGEPVVDIEIYDKADKVTLSYPGSEKGQGWKLTGPKAKVSELLGLINKNPNRTQEIMQKASDLGVVEAMVIPFKPVKSGGTAGSNGGVKAPKVSDYRAQIKAIGDKYESRTTLLPGGSYSTEPSLSAIKRVATTSKDPVEVAQAKADLKEIDFYNRQIDKTLKGPSSSTPDDGGSKASVTEKDIQDTINYWKGKGKPITRDAVIAELKRQGRM